MFEDVREWLEEVKKILPELSFAYLFIRIVGWGLHELVVIKGAVESAAATAS